MNQTPKQRLEFADELMDKMVFFRQFDKNILSLLRYNYNMASSVLDSIESKKNGFSKVEIHNAKWYFKIKYQNQMTTDRC